MPHQPKKQLQRWVRRYNFSLWFLFNWSDQTAIDRINEKNNDDTEKIRNEWKHIKELYLNKRARVRIKDDPWLEILIGSGLIQSNICSQYCSKCTHMEEIKAEGCEGTRVWEEERISEIYLQKICFY